MASDLPSGTVTFLLTDIEGSTKLWEAYPQAMKAALEKHDALITRAVESNGGHVIKSTGDGIHAVFDSPTDALSATIQAQQALQAEPWDEIKPGKLKVRMGVHSGEAQLRAGDYFGESLNRTARLMSVGHGEQILVSSVSVQLLQERLPTDAALRDLGEHRLKDLVKPEHVYQVIHPALPSSFPPLQSMDLLPNNLPIQLTSFIGRQGELSAAMRQLSSTRLLTLTGPGGTGKTRFALQLAADLAGTFPDGVWFVELAPLADGALLAQSIASVLGVREQMGMPLMDILINYLRAKRILLLLDSCEHLVEASAMLADQFLHACPNTKIIATSREALSIGGETVHPVPSLSLPETTQFGAETLAQSEAVQLFVERAVSASPRFALTDKNASYVAQICRRLDGIPLALELAAARVTVFGPDQIASRLDDRFKLLTAGGRTSVPRQQTLRAMIDWSYEILGEPERALLRRLSVFSGGWTFEAAETVCPDQDVLDLLPQLVNKSLVVMENDDTGTRYRLLESIRQYGHEKAVEVDEWNTFRRQHLAFFVDFAETGWIKLFSPEVFDWLPRQRADYDNIRSALEYSLEVDAEAALQLAGALSAFWLRCGQSAEGVTWISQALARSDKLPVLEGEAGQRLMTLRLRAWHGIAILAYLNDNSTALAASEASVDLARAMGDQRMLAINLAIVGWEKVTFNENAAALAAIEESLSVARASGDAYAEGIAFEAMAWYRLSVDHDHEASRRYESEGIALLEGNEFSWGGMQSSFGPARGALLRGDYADARARFAKALPVFEKIGDVHRVNMVKSWMAHMQRQEGNHQQAAAEYRKTILVWQKLGHRGAIAHQLESFAFVSVALQQAERAAQLFGAAEILREKIGMPMDPEERVEYDSQVASLRTSMDEKALVSAWSTGRSMTMDQAISYAVSHSDE